MIFKITKMYYLSGPPSVFYPTSKSLPDVGIAHSRYLRLPQQTRGDNVLVLPIGGCQNLLGITKEKKDLYSNLMYFVCRQHKLVSQ